MKKTRKFSEMDSEHKEEIVSQLGRNAAQKTQWEFHKKFPTEAAAALASDVSVMISDRRVRDVVMGLEAGGEFRPILIDDLGEDGPWMEGIHRSIAAEELGLKFLPAFVRIG